MFPFLISSSYLQSVNASNTFADQDNLCLPHGTTSIQLYHTPPNPSPFCISYLPSEITFQNFSSILKHHLCSEQWLVSQLASISNLILSNTHINHQSQSPNIIKQQSKTIFMLMLLIRRIQKKCQTGSTDNWDFPNNCGNTGFVINKNKFQFCKKDFFSIKIVTIHELKQKEKYIEKT